MPDSLSFVWSHSVHFAKFLNFTIFKSPLISQFLSDSSKVYTMYHNHTCTVIIFLAIGQKLQNILRLFEIFLKQDHMLL